MLVDNKFLFVNLPRSASTSFLISCLKQGVSVEHYNNLIGLGHVSIDILKQENEIIADNIVHVHEKLTDLENKFGFHHEIISVRRDRHERFLSLWKHVIDETYRLGEYATFKIFEKINVDDLLFYKSQDLISTDSKIDVIKKITCNKNYKQIHPQLVKMLLILISPTSEYHNNDIRIKWFDFNKLNELEYWVSDKLGINFKLEQSNSSKHFDSNIKLNEEFINKYNMIYDVYDLPKYNKKII